jgi:two-component system, response regulator PdtaR
MKHTDKFWLGSGVSSSPPAPDENHAAVGSPLAGKRVVIVEDEALTQLQLRRILTDAGLVIVGAAPNGAVGVEVVLREEPDIVLMDVNMPVMDGIEATRRITEQLHVCVVMLTAFSDDEYRHRAALAGASGYIVKPIDRVSLRPQLERACDTWQTRRLN